MATYNLGRILPVFRGEYQSSITYNKLDVVYVESRGSFVSQENENNQEPGTGNKWVLLSKDVTNSAAWEAFEQAEAQRENLVNTMVSTAESDVEDLISESTIRINNTVSGAESEMVQIGQEWNTLKEEMEEYGEDVSEIKTNLNTHIGNTGIHVTLADKQRWDNSIGFSGDYNDLTNKPTIPSKTSDLVNDSGFLTSHQSLKTINNESLIGTGNLTIEGFSGDYNDLTNKPTIPSKTSDLTNDSGFLTQHQSLKTINNESLIGTGNLTISVPTKTSDLTNDSGFLTEHQSLKTINNQSIIGTGNITIESGGDAVWGSITGSLANQTDLNTALTARKTDLDLSTLSQAQMADFYTNYSTMKTEYDLNWAGLPIVSINTWAHPQAGNVLVLQMGIYGQTDAMTGNDTTVSFIVKLVLANGVVQDFSATMDFKAICQTGSYNDLTDKPTIPSKTSDLTNDSGFLTSHQSIKTINNESLIGTGNLTISVPTKTSDLTNDSGFLTQHQSLKTINNESIVGTGNITIEGGGRDTWYGNQAQFDAIPESELDMNTDYYISGLISWDDINHPYIPTKVSDLNNDSNFTSLSQVRSEISQSLKVFEKRVQYVSQAEYDSMSQAGTLRDGVTYFIEDNASNTVQMTVEFADSTTATYNVYIN